MKKWNTIGLVIGIALIICGVVFLLYQAPSLFTETASDASFGADYYSYQYSATRSVAFNTCATAVYIKYLLKMFTTCFGLLFLFSGLITFVSFGKKVFVKTESKNDVTLKLSVDSIEKSEQPVVASEPNQNDIEKENTFE